MVTANTQSFCIGSIDTLKATGATTYTWSANAGSVSASSVTVNPTGNSTYTVTGTDANGCVNTNTVAVTVNSLPNVLAGITSPTLCLGHIDTLVATGATTYTWSANAGGLTVGSVTVSPSTNDTYTVTGVDVNGCLNTTTVSVTVSNCGVGVKQYSNHTVNIYPNPSNGNFTIESDTELGKIFIHDMLNREVYSAKINQTNTTINIESLVSGIYYVTISGNTIKIVKQ